MSLLGFVLIDPWLTDGFSVTVFGSWRGVVCIHGTHGNSHTAIIHSNTPASRVVREGGRKHQKTQKIRKTSNFNKGDREHWQLYWICYMEAILDYFKKMLTTQNRKFDVLCIF